MFKFRFSIFNLSHEFEDRNLKFADSRERSEA